MRGVNKIIAMVLPNPFQGWALCNY